MLPVTSCVPAEACATLRTISCVAAPCCSTAAAMEVVTPSISRIRLVMPPIAVTACAVTPCTSPIWRVISSVAVAVCAASAFTSLATTAKPRPAAPARAASIVALSARRLVWPAMDEIKPTTSPIRAELAWSAWTKCAVWSAAPTAA